MFVIVMIYLFVILSKRFIKLETLRYQLTYMSLHLPHWAHKNKQTTIQNTSAQCLWFKNQSTETSPGPTHTKPAKQTLVGANFLKENRSMAGTEFQKVSHALELASGCSHYPYEDRYVLKYEFSLRTESKCLRNSQVETKWKTCKTEKHMVNHKKKNGVNCYL